MTHEGTLTTLYNFCAQSGCADGALPSAGGALLQAANGDFYGATGSGGFLNYPCNDYLPVDGCGTVFSLSVGLGPFVKTQTTSGLVGQPIKILGTDLTGATGVTFNGTPAGFTVEAASLIAATVPVGATSGTVQVVTPGGTLSSNVPFRVLHKVAFSLFPAE